MPLRVLQLCAVDFTVAKFLIPLVEFLEARGCEVTVACTPGDEWPRLQARGLRLLPIPIQRSYDLVSHRRSARALRDVLVRDRFDVVHVHTPIASLVGRWAAAQAKVPLILYTAHGFYFHDEMPVWTRRVHVELERWGARRHHHLFTQSEEDRQSAIREGIASPTTVTWIGNGVDMLRFAPASQDPEAVAALRLELDIPAEAPVVLTIARLVREKGLAEFIEAAALVHARAPKTHFVIVGAALASDRDDFGSEIQRMIVRHRLSNSVHFAGLRTDIPALMALCNVYCLPSWREGMPRSIIEAMAAARPVVATDIRGCREEVVEGETGYLVPLRDPTTLADRILRLIENPAHAEQAGAAGRIRAQALFDEQLVLERQWRVMQALIQREGIAA